MRRWVLVSAIIVAAVILAVVTYRTTFQLDAIRAQAVFEATLGLADEKVDRVDRAIVEADDAVMALGEGGRADDIPRRWRGQAARRTPTVAHVLVLDSGSAREIVAFASRMPSPADDALRLLLLRRILPDVDLSTLPLGQLKHLHRAYDGAFFLVSYWRAQQIHGDGSSTERLIIVNHDRDAVARELLEQVVPDPRVPTARVNVVDDEGRVVFGPPLSKSDLIVAKRFPTTLYAWRLQVAPTASGELALKARRRRLLEMSLLALSCVVVVAGVVALLLATAQERRLAALRGEFVANVSHELKTPLALVRMFGELLMTGRVASEEKRRDYLSIIVRESERLTALIENVLDFARVERGKAAYDFAPADVPTVVGRAVDACRYRAETEGMRLEVDVQDGAGEAVVDERALQLAVINLVENAIKYASGTGAVRVEVAPDGGDRVAVRVIDHGSGIDPDDRERIFERFYRGKRAGERQVRGSGIGLSLVWHVVHAHGGEVFVQETPGGGSTFVVRIPVAGPG
ncbi:MAG: HAMP domain-containing histidine kinase [Deltaproteobacteria bacterium]|nr:HAMP domain-containing histidine kinase [Deltaproteobacteria bacterium]